MPSEVIAGAAVVAALCGIYALGLAVDHWWGPLARYKRKVRRDYRRANGLDLSDEDRAAWVKERTRRQDDVLPRLERPDLFDPGDPSGPRPDDR